MVAVVGCQCNRNSASVDEPWFEVQPGKYILNGSLCHPDQPPLEIELDLENRNISTLEVKMGTGNISCLWFVHMVLDNPYQIKDHEPFPRFLTATVQQLISQNMVLTKTGNFSLQYQELGINTNYTVNVSQLLQKNITISSPVSLSFHLLSETPQRADSLIIHAQLNKGEFIHQLPVVKLSPTAGFVTSPTFDSINVGYPLCYNGHFHLNVATSQSVFINFVTFDLRSCDVDTLQFTVGENGTSWSKCGSQVFNPQLYRDSVSVKFKTKCIEENMFILPCQRVGFKMNFALIPREHEPVQVTTSLYNCSGPHFHVFAPVLRCNMVVECTEGEDETDCEFYSEECGPGSADSGSKCYRLVQGSSEVSWSEAHSYCLRHNEQLITMATPDEFNFFKNMWSLKKGASCVYVGLHLPSSIELTPVVAHMYRFVWRWTDGRAAFYINILDNGDIPSCAGYTPHRQKRDYDSYRPADSCISHFFSRCYPHCDFFCEKQKSNLPDPIQLPAFQPKIESSKADWNIGTLTCVNDHVTKDFLSCDHDSVCGVKDDYMTSCRTRDIEVPMFVCERSKSIVHYTLVCDHIEHCDDNTDEDFCQFDPCHDSTCQSGQCLDFSQICDGHIDCWDLSDELKCQNCEGDYLRYSLKPPFSVSFDFDGHYRLALLKDLSHCPNTHFSCLDGICLPVFLRCNDFEDCRGGEDEVGCETYTCPGFYRCLNTKICILPDMLCDGKSFCPQLDDEMLCDFRCPDVCHCQTHAFFCSQTFNISSYPNLHLLEASRSNTTFGDIGVNKLLNDCPSTHFLCPDNICLPIYLRCNNVDDCPGREDEVGCDTYTCPGFYRCWKSKVCLIPDMLCDGKFHCPQQDDEMLCDFRCPDVCHCQGHAFVCSQTFNISSYPDLRLLDASRSNTTFGDIGANKLLIYARLSYCRISTLQQISLLNLRHLDLSNNLLKDVDMNHFILMKNLRVLLLFGNPLKIIARSSDRSSDQIELRFLDLSQTLLQVYNGTVFASFPKLQFLNLSRSQVTHILDIGFQSTPDLQSLDTRLSPLSKFPFDMLRNLKTLRTVYTGNFKLCCPVLLPRNFDFENCHAKQDLIASCEDLLKSNAYRVFLWVFAALSLVGNTGSFVARIRLDRSGLGSFGVFVTNLAISDLFMGIYLAMIGTADFVSYGRYLFHDLQWKNSIVCSAAGFFSLLSSEVSAFSICLITLDRFLVLRVPFSKVFCNHRSAYFTCAVMWLAGFLLASIPLLPVTSHWHFFSQTGICIPLPFTLNFSGYNVFFTAIIVLNLILFVAISCGQAVICWSVRGNMFLSTNTAEVKNATIARRMTTIIVSDFLCWFPIGLMRALVSAGTLIPNELNVAVAIFVLPINSALNPFLYIFNVIMEKRKMVREVKLLKTLESRVAKENLVTTH